MKVTIEETADLTENFSRGDLYVYENTNCEKYIVLVTGKGGGGCHFSGTVVFTTTATKPIGYHSSGFAQASFKRFNGRLTMET